MARPGKSILLVDDDVDVLEMFGAILAKEGFAVRPAGNGNAAIAAIDAGAGFDLLITDIRMPGAFDGFALARAARKRLPALQVIYISGWVETLPARDYVLGPLLCKPLRPATLCLAARQVLGLTPSTDGPSASDAPSPQAM